IAATRLVLAFLVAPKAGKLGKAIGNVRAAQTFVRDGKSLRRRHGRCQKTGLAMAACGGIVPRDEQEAASFDQRFSKLASEPVEDLVRPNDERDIGLPLADRLAGDPGVAGPRSDGMRRREAAHREPVWP